MARWFLVLFNKLFSALIIFVLIVALLYSGYALWDNGQIYASAEDVMSEAREIKDNKAFNDEAPGCQETAELSNEQNNESAQETELQAMFRQLHDINPDICGWVTMNGTAIDYPVVYSSNNRDYISTDIYGNFAIVGSIFLDFRNQIDGSDTYSLLYGHNMSEHRMFSDINLYKNEEFFKENHRGAYYTPERGHWLETISIILTTASDSYIFNPVTWDSYDKDLFLEIVQKNAVFVNDAGLNALKAKLDAGEKPHIVALSTCSGEFTDARTILLTLIDPDVVSEGTGEEASTEVTDKAPEETTEEPPEEVPVEGQEAER